MPNESVDRAQVQDDVIRIIALTLMVGKESLSGDSAIGNVRSWDSLSNLRILIEVEAYMNKKISIDDLVNVRSVSDWVAVCQDYSEREQD